MQTTSIMFREVREFIKDTRPKTNTTRGGRKAHRPTPKTTVGLDTPPSSRTASSGRFVGGRPQTPARLGVANPPGPISVSDPTTPQGIQTAVLAARPRKGDVRKDVVYAPRLQPQGEGEGEGAGAGTGAGAGGCWAD